MSRTAVTISVVGLSPPGVNTWSINCAVDVLHWILSGLSLKLCCERRASKLRTV